MLRFIRTITSSAVARRKCREIANNEDFVQHVLNAEYPVVVNFHAEWCDPCKILTPRLKELIEPLVNIDLAMVDVEKNPELVEHFEVKGVPAVVAFKNGHVVDKFIGLVDDEMISNLTGKLIGKKGAGVINDNNS